MQRFDTLTAQDIDRIGVDARVSPPPAVVCLYVLERGEDAAEDIRLAVAGQVGARTTLRIVGSRDDLAQAARTIGELPDGAVVILVAGDARLRPQAAYAFARALARGDCDAAYSDHDHEDPEGRRTRPVFKPAMSPVLMSLLPYAGPVVAVRLTVDNRTTMSRTLARALDAIPPRLSLPSYGS